MLFIRVLVLILLASSVFAQNFFPIVAWIGIPAEELSDARFAELAEAGFTIDFCTTWPKPPKKGRLIENFWDLETNKKALHLAKKYGVKIMVADKRLDFRKRKLEDILADIPEIVKDYKDEPALWGYFIMDEPQAGHFPILAKLVQALREHDPEHPSYINLLPTYATRGQLQARNYYGYVIRYIQEVSPPFVSFDHYAILESGLREDFYYNLEVIRSISMQYGLEFWAFTRSMGRGPYPVPTEGHLRWQVYSALAYGAKGMQYFTYWTPITVHNLKTALIGKDRKRTEIYYYAKRINHELLTLSPYLKSFKSKGVYHTPPLPKGTKSLDKQTLISSLTGGPALIGIFEGEKGENYFMLVNRDPFTSHSYKLALPAKYTIYKIDKNTGSPHRVKTHPLGNRQYFDKFLPAGDGELFLVKSPKLGR